MAHMMMCPPRNLPLYSTADGMSSSRNYSFSERHYDTKDTSVSENVHMVTPLIGSGGPGSKAISPSHCVVRQLQV